jgi:hypothetical protein
MSDPKAQSLLVGVPGVETTLVIALCPESQGEEIDELLSALVPELARGGVRGGLLVVGETTLVLRNTHQEILVDEIETAELLRLADLDAPAELEARVEAFERWIGVLAGEWRERLAESPLRELLVPHLVAGLAGEITRCDGVWGSQAHRVASPD